MSTKKDLGQYFTVDESLQKFVYDVTENKGQRLLEPSFGAGHLLRLFLLSNPDYPAACYELDNKIVPIVTFTEAQSVKYGDFMKTHITDKFKTIIGNPPYVKVDKNKNLYLQFIEKCLSLLDVDGELVFIVPSDFLKLTSAAGLIRKMVTEGSFTDFLFPNNEKLFEDSIVDVVIFRYKRGLKSRSCLRNGVASTWHFNEGIVTFTGAAEAEATVALGELFDCYVGFVSGLDSVFCNELGTLEVLCDKDKVKKFICVDGFPTGKKPVDDYLNAHKKALLERKIRKFNDDNWFTWGAIRNKAAIDLRKGKPCIYVRTMTRQSVVAFQGIVQYFGGGLLCLVPKVEGLDLAPVVAALNSSDVKKDYLYSGRFKIGQKQVRFVRV
jgi:adenine-specific DNA-methyltransferase